MATNLLRLVSRQAFKPVGARYYRSTPKYNTEYDGHCDDGRCHDSNRGSKSDSATFATLKDFSQLDKDFSNVKLKLDYLESGQKEMKTEIKDLGNKMDRKFDKTDGKIDRVLYGIVTGLVGFVLKGGFDYYESHKK